MKEKEISRISQKMKELEGAHLVSVGRASSLAWFLFAKNAGECGSTIITMIFVGMNMSVVAEKI